MRTGALAWQVAVLSIVGSLPVVRAGAVHAQAGVAAVASTISPEDEEKARGHFRLGRAYYDNGDFAKAAVEFEAAYAISQRAALLYNIYLAYRDASDTRHAADALRKYLKLEQKIENRGQLESRLAALDRSLADGSAPAPAPAQPVAAAPAQPNASAAAGSALQPVAAAATAPPPPAEVLAPSPEPTQPVPSASPAKPLPVLPIALMGAGGAMIVGSLITGVMTLGKKSELNTAQAKCTQDMNCQTLPQPVFMHLKATQNSGKTLAVVTDVLLLGGMAIAGTGAALFLLNTGKTEQAPPKTSAALACAPGACVGTLRMQF
jgi:tetratricopeptide (TPR) repeat protein